jgi:nitrogen regulatory protein PII 2
MKEVIAFIRPDKWQATREVAIALGAEEIMHWRVQGRGHQHGLRYLRPQSDGEETGMQFLPKWMAGWMVESQQVEALVAAIIEANCTNNYGDGKVFVCPVDGPNNDDGFELDF